MNKIIKFTPSLSKQILSGSKTSTWRLFDDKGLTTGDTVTFVNKETGEAFATALLSSVVEKTLGTLIDDDYEGHQRYESEEAMYEDFRQYYGDKVGPYSPVKIIRFTLKT